MTDTIKSINEQIEKDIKKYRALKKVLFSIDWSKSYYIQKEIEKVWHKIEFLKKLRKQCISKK